MAESKSFEERPLNMSKDPIAGSATENSDSPRVTTNAVLGQNDYTTDILKRLALQVEYYFSATNLNKDTYVSTLRSLNDGYVPVTIIANFGKVRSLIPHEPVKAVCLASEDHSELLEVVKIDSSTGKRVSSIKKQLTNFVQAVGPIGGEPIPASKLSVNPTFATKKSVNSIRPVPAEPTPSNVQTTVVLREVPNAVQESDIRELFSFEKSPMVHNVHKDVANCWFVTLDITSRDEMLEVMLALRQAKYPSGDSVKAGVKSGVAMSRDAVILPVTFYSPSSTNTAPVRSNNGRKNKKKKNGKSRNNKTANLQNGNGTVNKGKNDSSNRRRANATKSKDSDKTGGKSNWKKGSSLYSPPLNLGGEQFPPLPSEFSYSSSNKVEVEKVPTHYELGRKGAATSDASSTATTSTSSSKSPPLETLPGGYAAALRKAPSAVQSVKKSTQDNNSETVRQTVEKTKKKGTTATRNKRNTARKQSKSDLGSEVVVKPPTWGHGSFADILRTEEAV